MPDWGPSNLDLRVRIMNYMTARTELRDIRAEVLGIGTDSKAASATAARGFNTMHSGLRSMLGIAGIAGVGIGLKDLISSGMTLQNNQAQLRGALVGAAGGGTAAYNKLNDAMRKLSEAGGFGWSQQLESLTLFLRNTQSVPEAMEATRAAVLLARGAHIDLGTAQHAVASAMGGNTWALKQYIKNGIVPANKALIALTVQHRNTLLQLKNQEWVAGSGNHYAQVEYYNKVTQENARFAAAKRAAIQSDIGTESKAILDTITTNYGGSIQRFANTTQGKLTIMLNVWKNAFAQAGKGMLPTFNHIVDALTSMGRWLDKNRWVLKVIAGLTATLGALWAGSKMVRGVMGMYRGLNLAYRSMRVSVFLLSHMGVEAQFAGKSVAEIRAQWKKVTPETREATLAQEEFQAVQEANLGLAEATSIALKTMIWPALLMVGLMAFTYGLEYVYTHWKQVKEAGRDTLHFLSQKLSDVGNFLKGLGNGIAHVFKSVLHGILSVVNWVAAKVKWLFTNTPLGVLFQVQKGIAGFAGNLLSGHIGAAGSSLLHGATGALHALTFGAVHAGGLVRARYFDTGGPVGTDTIPGWLAPGEYVINRSAASQIGYDTLGAINAGNLGAAQHITITPAPVTINIDGRRVAQAVVRYTINRAARGPSSLVGGSLTTGVGGPTHVYD